MGILIAVVLAVATCACFSPDVRDCELACASDANCVQDQVCTADHWCAAPAFASGCTPAVDLHIHIDGPGMVAITGGGTCDMMDCTFQVPSAVATTLTAVPIGNHPFEQWQGMTCMTQPATCTLTPTAPTTASAKFH